MCQSIAMSPVSAIIQAASFTSVGRVPLEGATSARLAVAASVDLAGSPAYIVEQTIDGACWQPLVSSLTGSPSAGDISAPIAAVDTRGVLDLRLRLTAVGTAGTLELIVGRIRE